MKTIRIFAGIVSLALTFATTNYYNINAKAGYISEVVELVNQERAKVGVAPLKSAPILNEIAQIRANELMEHTEHTRPDGSAWYTILREYDIKYSNAAENLAAGLSTPESVMKNWINSSGHYANIIEADSEYIGVGMVYEPDSTYGYYWIQVFVGGTELETILKGDANVDGTIDIADAVAVAAYVGNSEKNLLTEQGILNGDVHNSGNGLNANDVLTIQQYLSGIISEL